MFGRVKGSRRAPLAIIVGWGLILGVPAVRADSPGADETIDFLIRHFELQARATTIGIPGGLYPCATKLSYDKTSRIMTATMDCDESEENKDYSLGGGIWKFNPHLISHGACNFRDKGDRSYYKLSILNDLERYGNAIQSVRDDFAADSWVGTIKPGDMVGVANIAWFTNAKQCERALKAFEYLGTQEQDPF